MRRLFIDIETSPNIGFFWKPGYKVQIGYQAILKERAIICVCYKWQGDEEVSSLSWDLKQDDKAMLKALLPVLEEADEIVAHYGDGFDIPWIKTRFLFHGFTFPDYKTVDTCTWASRKLNFNSNKLDYIADFFGIGRKLRTRYDLWKDVVWEKCPEALAYMVEYCEWDVQLLEKVWERLSVIMKPKSHAGVMVGLEKWTCPRCESKKVYSNKEKMSAAGTVSYQFKCRACGGYYSVSKKGKQDYDYAKA